MSLRPLFYAAFIITALVIFWGVFGPNLVTLMPELP